MATKAFASLVYAMEKGNIPTGELFTPRKRKTKKRQLERGADIAKESDTNVTQTDYNELARQQLAWISETPIGQRLKHLVIDDENSD